jgi:hypothetical protein
MAQVKEIKEKEVINIEEKDIERVKKFRADYAETTARMGEIEVELLNAELLLENIKVAKNEQIEKYKSLRLEEVNISSEFNETYGQGEFNLEEATFTPMA